MEPSLSFKNRQLHQVPSDELQRLWPVLKKVELKPRQTLRHWNMPIEPVYFLEDGMVSVAGPTGAVVEPQPGRGGVVLPNADTIKQPQRGTDGE